MKNESKDKYNLRAGCGGARQRGVSHSVDVRNAAARIIA